MKEVFDIIEKQAPDRELIMKGFAEEIHQLVNTDYPRMVADAPDVFLFSGVLALQAERFRWK